MKNRSCNARGHHHTGCTGASAETDSKETS